MYRVLLILTFLHFARPHYWCSNHPKLCHRHHRDYKRPHSHADERFFQRLANDFIEADNNAKTFCAQHQDATSKEVYDQDLYKLIINLPNYNESTIEVKIKHRVLFIKAEKENEYNKYVNVKVLSEVLNISAAKWYYGNQELTIAVPYKVAVTTQTPTACGEDINSNVVDVPKSEHDPNEVPEIDVRFLNSAGHENITENIV